QRVVQAGVEDVLLVVSRAFNSRDTELRVPDLFQLIASCLKAPRWQLGVEIGARLLDTDERSTHLSLDDRTRFRIKSRERTDGLAGHPGLVIDRQDALIDALGVERLSEPDDEVALEVGQLEVAQVSIHTVRVVADDFLTGRIYRNISHDSRS